MKKIITLLGFLAIALMPAYGKEPTRPTGDAYTNVNSSTNIGSSYVQLIASTAVKASAMKVANTGSNAITIALGPASSESDFVDIAGGDSAFIPFRIEKGTRISAVRATGTSVSDGELSISLFD